MRTAEKQTGAYDDMRAEYDFSGGIRGKYAKRLAKGTTVIVLEPDVAARFRTAKAVNAALRSLLPKRPARKKDHRLAAR